MVLVLVGLGLWSVGQNRVVNNTQWNLDKYVYDCLKELGVDSCIIIIMPVETKIYGKYDGVCKKIDDNSYFIGLSNKFFYKESLSVVTHELVHVWQYYSKRLCIIDVNNIMFNSVMYHTSVKYHYDDPQEIEARNIGDQLYKKLKPNFY